MIIKKSCFHFISKFMICLLCCLMLFCLISKPLTAHASVAATVTIGAYGVIKVVMSSKVLVGLIVGSFSGFAMSMLVPDMDDWYDSDPVVRNWADQYNGAISGGEVISIPASVQDSIRARYDVNSSINISTLYVPYDLTHLERVSAAHVFGTDVAAQLEANNTLLQKANLLLSDIIGAFDSLSSAFTSALNNISTSFRSEFSQFKTWYQTINENMKLELHQIVNSLSDLNTNLVSEFSQFKTWYQTINENTKIELHQVVNWLSDLNTNLVSELSQLKSWSSSINSTIKDEIKGVKTNLVEIQQVIAREFAGAIGSITSVLEDGFTSLESKIDSIVSSPGAFGPSIDTITGKLDTLLDPVQTWIGSINDTLVDSFSSLKSAVVSLPDGIISLTDSIKTNVISGFSSITEWFSKLYTDFKALLNSLVSWLSTINTNVKSELGQLKTWASNINTTIKNEIKGVKTNLVEIQQVIAREFAGAISSISSNLDLFSTSVHSGFAGVGVWITSLSDTLVNSFTDFKEYVAYNVSNKLSFINTSISSGLTDLGTKVKSFIDSCTVAITDSITLVGQKIDVLIDSFADFAQPAPSEPNEVDKNQVILGGINSGLGYFGQSNGVLSKYATGFLAAISIFNLFAEVPFFSDLITISVCIGLVGVLLGIVLSAAKSDSQSHSKFRGKAHSSNGG